MSFGGATINKMNGGITKSGDSDRVVVLVMGMTLVGSLEYNTKYEILDANGITALGITDSTDSLNGDLAAYHLSEMQRLCPDTTFYLIPVDKSKTIAQLVADASFKAVVRSVEKRNVIGIGGLNTAVANSLTDAPLLQGFINAFATEKILIDGIFVEGVGTAGTPIAVTAYNDNRTITAPNISYVIAADPAISALQTAYNKRAAIGTALGSVAVRRVHEDIGSVDIEVKPSARKGEENYSLTDDTTGRWLSAQLSDGKPFSELSGAEQKSLTSKGWIFVGKFEEYPGFYFSGCPTCVSKSSDYAYFNFNCIWNKGARIIRKTLIPRVRSKVPTDPATGYIKSTWITSAQEAVNLSLDNMVNSNNIDDKEIYINPAQQPDETTPLNIKARLVVGKVVHEFEVDLGLTDKL